LISYLKIDDPINGNMATTKKYILKKDRE